MTLFDHECPTCRGRGYIDDDELRHLIEDQIGVVSRKSPVTSLRAATEPSNVISFGTQRYNVLDALYTRGPLNAAEIAPLIGRSRNQTATRLLELRRSGFVEYLVVNDDIVQRPTGDKGDKGLVQAITPLGVMALRAAQRDGEQF